MKTILTTINDAELSDEIRKYFSARNYCILKTDSEAETIDYALIELNNFTPINDIIVKLKKKNPEIKILFLTENATLEKTVTALKSGAAGVISKRNGPAFIYRAIMKSEQKDISIVNLNVKQRKEYVKKLAKQEKLISLDNMYSRYIRYLYKKNNNNLSETSREAGAHRKTMQRLIAKLRD